MSLKTGRKRLPFESGLLSCTLVLRSVRNDSLLLIIQYILFKKYKTRTQPFYRQRCVWCFWNVVLLELDHVRCFSCPRRICVKPVCARVTLICSKGDGLWKAFSSACFVQYYYQCPAFETRPFFENITQMFQCKFFNKHLEKWSCRIVCVWKFLVRYQEQCLMKLFTPPLIVFPICCITTRN